MPGDKWWKETKIRHPELQSEIEALVKTSPYTEADIQLALADIFEHKDSVDKVSNRYAIPCNVVKEVYEKRVALQADKHNRVPQDISYKEATETVSPSSAACGRPARSAEMVSDVHEELVVPDIGSPTDLSNMPPSVVTLQTHALQTTRPIASSKESRRNEDMEPVPKRRYLPSVDADKCNTDLASFFTNTQYEYVAKSLMEARNDFPEAQTDSSTQSSGFENSNNLLFDKTHEFWVKEEEMEEECVGEDWMDGQDNTSCDIIINHEERI